MYLRHRQEARDVLEDGGEVLEVAEAEGGASAQPAPCATGEGRELVSNAGRKRGRRERRKGGEDGPCGRRPRGGTEIG